MSPTLSTHKGPHKYVSHIVEWQWQWQPLAPAAVSHNVPEAKPLDEGPTRTALYDNHTLERDWGVQQV